MATEIALPFRLDLTGRVIEETDQDKLIRQHIEALVGTETGERMMLPTYGVPALSTVFTPGGVDAADILTGRVQRAATIWEPGVTVTSVTPTLTETGVVGVNVNYQRADSADSVLSPKHVNTAVISAGGTVKEVIRG